MKNYINIIIISSGMFNYFFKKRKAVDGVGTKIEKNSFLPNFERSYVSDAIGVALITGLAFTSGYLQSPRPLSQPVEKKIEIIDTIPKIPPIEEDTLLIDDFSPVYIEGLIIDKEFTKEDIFAAARKQGLTGILKQISTQEPSYVSGGNVNVLANLAEIDLFNENIQLESRLIAPRYVGNNVNDILSVTDVAVLYSKLISTGHGATSKKFDVGVQVNEYLAQNKLTESKDNFELPQNTFKFKFPNVTRLEDEVVEEDNMYEPEPVSPPLPKRETPILSLSTRKLKSNDYVDIAQMYNLSDNKYKALDDIVEKYDISMVDASSAVYRSKNYAGVDNIKFSKAIKSEFSLKDSATLIKLYLNNTVKKAKELFKDATDVNVSSSFYAALDSLTEKMGLGKLRKSKLSADQKKALDSNLQEYVI